MDLGTVGDRGTVDDRTLLETETEIDGVIAIGTETVTVIVGPTVEATIAAVGGPPIPGVRLAPEELRRPKETGKPPGRTLGVLPRSRGWPWRRGKAEMARMARLRLHRGRASITVALERS